MALHDIIEAEIRREADKLAVRHQQYHNGTHLAYVRDTERLAAPPAKVIHTPAYWGQSRRFNPFYVLKHSRPIAISIARKLQNGTYSPRPAVIRAVPKGDGTTRSVNVYEIPDAAISHFYYNRLLEKNRHRFSAFSYAYRSDKNVQFAIQDIAVDLAYHARLFIAEFDFSDFFGSIEHPHLFQQLHENGFLVTHDEETVIRSFLRAHGPKGIPQGTSISLFLANLVCWRLDKKLELIGVKFARYADDSVIWTTDYTRICKSFEAIQEFSGEAGVPINIEKSKGINLLVKKGFKSEFAKTKYAFDFLGYRLAVGKTSIGKKAVLKIKRQISFLLYENLIQPLLGPQLKAISIPANNQDHGFLVAISQVRRYLYGNLTEEKLANYLQGGASRISFKGIMSFYPLVNDEDQLRSLDGWLVAVIHRCVAKRASLLRHWNFDRDNQFPFNVTKAEIVARCATPVVHGKPLLSIPSFLRIYRAIQKGVVAGGIEASAPPHEDSSG